MKLNTSFAILTTLPLLSSAWVFGSDLMLLNPTDSLVFTHPVRSLIQQQHQQLQNLMNRDFPIQLSPRYEINDDKDKFEIMVEVPGMTIDDVHVSLEDDGKILSIRGSRETKEENYGMTSSFTQRFSLDPSVDVDHFTANLKDGVLLVTAPKDMKKLEETVRRIPITYLQEETTSVDSTESGKAEEPKTEAEHVNQ